MDHAMTILLACFDLLLSITLIWLAWQLLRSTDIFKAIIFFICFGLLMSIAWVRMHAPDVALAEAAIGAGLTGPLFLAALMRMERRNKKERRLDPEKKRNAPENLWKARSRRMSPLLWTLTGLTICLAGLLFWTVRMIPRPLPGLAGETADHLGASGVDNPVTAVLLNFRGYDTMLEVLVLLLGAVTIWSISHAPFPPRFPDTSPVQRTTVRLLIPLICLIAGYFIWQGAYQTGGAFQGGAVLSAALVLLLISDFVWLPNMHSLPLRLGMTLGSMVFAALAVLGIFAEGVLLKYPSEHAGAFLLFLEASCGISIGLMLAAFFAGGRPASDLREEPHKAKLYDAGRKRP
ncbi:MAG: hydrogenase subunit MbhD domain-containing protein [Desulfobulbaceae bacterium]|nr:hydrogenase subunit MbhD domain-containing protein [Desulfobulbaceae bacterium]